MKSGEAKREASNGHPHGPKLCQMRWLKTEPFHLAHDTPVLPAVIGEPEQEPPFLAAVGHMHTTLLDLGPWQTHPFSDSQGTAYHHTMNVKPSSNLNSNREMLKRKLCHHFSHFKAFLAC